MKKKVLFIIGTLQSGGVSKSIVNLLNAFDRTRYDVHLLVFTMQGDVFSRYLPDGVTLHVNKDIAALHENLSGVKKLLGRGRILLAIGSLVRMALSKVNKSWAGRWMAYLMPAFTEETFDLIVDYGGQQAMYYMVNKLNGRKKVSFFHNDYSKWPYYYSADKIYYAYADRIYTISDTCVQALKNYFPQYTEKIMMMENISSPELIHRQAEEPLPIALPKGRMVIATLGHLCRRKGWDFAIEAARIMKDSGVSFVWLQIGKVIENDLVEKIKEYGLDDCFVFTGIQSNPYPFLNACDIYVHPSRFEGKSIALDEAKILCKPIVVTRFSTVNDQFEDDVNAVICDMDGVSLAHAIMDLCHDTTRQKRYCSWLAEHIKDNSDEVNKLYEVLESDK